MFHKKYTANVVFKGNTVALGLWDTAGTDEYDQVIFTKKKKTDTLKASSSFIPRYSYIYYRFFSSFSRIFTKC